MNRNKYVNQGQTISNNNPFFIYPMIFIIIFLFIALIFVFYNIKIGASKNKADKEIVYNVFIVLLVCFFIVIICISLLPYFKEIKNLFLQIYNVTYVILYTIFLILFFSLLSDKILNTYAFIIVPITLLFGIYMFYNALKVDYISKFNLNYERIKTVILLFCLLTIIILYYNVNPGDLIHKYFGFSLLLTIVIFTFMLLYLIIVMTLPTYSSTQRYPINLLSVFSNFSVYGSFFFILFIIGVTYLLSIYPNGFSNVKNKTNVAAIIILVLLISICWGSILAANLIPEFLNNTVNINLDLFKRALLLMFGFVISGLIIFCVVYNIQSISGKFGITSFILNLLVVIAILALIYKTIYVKLPEGNTKKNAFFDIIINSIFYIPCLFTNTFDMLMGLFVTNYDNKTTSYLYLILIAVLLLVIYFVEPLLYNKVNLQGGKLLVNQPISIDKIQNLGNYKILNESNIFDYHFAISFWFYLDAYPPNTNPNYKSYISLLNYADKPNISYNSSENTLMITMKRTNFSSYEDKSNQDKEKEEIIYKKENILLQKWNNIIINYDSGILDIFLNGVLAKSNNGIIPYYTLDALTVGQDPSIAGKICNVVYFNKSLTNDNIYYLYNMVKNVNPPITQDSNIYILK